MADRQQWHVAWARFTTFRNSPPRHWHPRAVEEFHAILLALEAASPDDDLTAFRIPKDMMKPRVVSMRPATFRTPGHVNCSDEVYRDPEYAKRQVEGVTVYFDSRNPLRL
jgi:hypothetical protein